MFSAFTFSVFFSTEKNSTYAQLRHREVTQRWVGFFSVEDSTCLGKLHTQNMLFRCQFTSGFSVPQLAVSQILPVDFNTVNSCSLAGSNFIDLQINHGLMLTYITVLLQIPTVRSGVIHRFQVGSGS